MVVGLWGSSFKNAFHTLSYRFAAVILVILYSRGKGKELKDAEQGCIADTLTIREAFLASLDGKNCKKTCELVFFLDKSILCGMDGKRDRFSNRRG